MVFLHLPLHTFRPILLLLRHQPLRLSFCPTSIYGHPVQTAAEASELGPIPAILRSKSALHRVLLSIPHLHKINRTPPLICPMIHHGAGLFRVPSYPFQLHAPNAKNCVPYDLIIVSGIPKARAPRCLGGIVTLEGIQPCAKCSRLTLDIKIIRERATRSYEQIRNHDQLDDWRTFCDPA
ncbi:hypothetical protein R3P38DRAFT_2810669 [Favolaschia claudopus]|uniref:Uncharacterized protein n=1 Tax=Favolaschia claudopus TaxID=2862362 RepID=A0AAV9ZAA2_9AGAR